MPRRRAAAAVPVEEPEEVFEEVDELEELEDPEELDDLEEEPEPEPVPAKRTRAKATPTPAKATKAATKAAAPRTESSEFDSNWLAEHIGDSTGVEMDSRGVRMLLRKMAKNGELEREVGTDRARYTFPKGANDLVVKKIIQMVKSGKSAPVEEAPKAARVPASAKAATSTRRTAKAAPPAKAAPAKATTRRRRAAAE